MPTRFIQRNIAFPLESFYSRFLSSQVGWQGGTVEDIASMSWNDTLKNLTVYKLPERNLTRYIIFSALEVFSIVSGLPEWGTGTAADIKTVYLDAAGRKVIICKLSEAG